MASAQSIRERYDRQAQEYERAYTDVNQRLYWLAYDHLTWTAVQAVLPADRPLRVLDAGGGGGKFGVRFAEGGHHVTVLDLSPQMLVGAQRRFVESGLAATFVEGDIRRLDFPSHHFELVFCEGDPVSYCGGDYPQAISELFRVAAPGAPVILGLDNRQEYFKGELHYGNPAKALAILLGGLATCPYGLPIHAFTQPELHRSITASGGTVEEIFGKPVLFQELLLALKAERGPDFDLWGARAEILALQLRLAHEDYACSGGHLQVMARRR